MKQITSTGSECRLSGGVTVPAGRTVQISEAELERLRLHDAHFRAQVASRALVVAEAEHADEPDDAAEAGDESVEDEGHMAPVLPQSGEE